MIRLALHDDNDAREHLPLDPTGPWRHVLRPDGPERGGSGANTIYQAPASRPPVHWPMTTPPAGIQIPAR